jgi:hypothetical protein
MTSNTAASPPTYFRYELLDAAPHELQIYQKVVHQVVPFESFATALWAKPFRKQGGRIRPQFLRVNACARFCLRREVWVSTKDDFLSLVVKVGALGDMFELRHRKYFCAKGCPEPFFRRQAIGSGRLQIWPEGWVWTP